MLRTIELLFSPLLIPETQQLRRASADRARIFASTSYRDLYTMHPSGGRSTRRMLTVGETKHTDYLWVLPLQIPFVASSHNFERNLSSSC